MKKIILLSAALLSFSAYGTAQNDTIGSIDFGSPMYDPNELSINFGDTVIFALDSQYNAREVSMQSWANNDPTGLPGGFEVPYGGGTVGIYLLTGTHYFLCTSEPSMKGVIYVLDGTASIHFTAANEPQLYPNPATQTLFLKMQETASYSVADVTGRTVLSGEPGFSELTAIDVSSLPRGVFVVTVSDGATASRQKVILE